MSLAKGAVELAGKVAALAHADELGKAARLVADFSKVTYTKREWDKEETSIALLQSYLHGLLNSRSFTEAAQLLWSPTQFNPCPKSTQQVWSLFEEADTGLIMGAAKMSKCLGIRDLCRLADGRSLRPKQ